MTELKGSGLSAPWLVANQCTNSCAVLQPRQLGCDAHDATAAEQRAGCGSVPKHHSTRDRDTFVALMMQRC